MNSVVLMGRLTKDVELKFIPGSGMAVANFTLAVDKNLSRDKKAEFEQKNKPTADFIRVVVWGKQAENCANYLGKGKRAIVNGSIEVSSYKTNTGETRYSTDVNASHVEFVDFGDKQETSKKAPTDTTFDPNDFDFDEDAALPWD